MARSFWFPVIKNAYDSKLLGYTVDGVKVFVVVGYITSPEYQEITGTDYVS
ncbi:Phage uncharacterised protein (Phage_XkdX) [Paenibacillus tianmuensis]|uniref:Phage uncharacterized protein (Phage_XkdX) n=1 Tax=Paenibacillus tianmuensis TaxID=624147 RepID=A0A1G4U0A5_9BACL|nr:XkdX family protein [Paenibacillus tianmuensis]SCW87051.1 Phage uncharacterised protein (Phage_XkdX) [Paenibacillus tianmuensis]